MAYQIDRYNNTLLTTVEDGTVDQTTDLKFIGKNYAGYGEIQNENMLFLLENFSGTVAPPRALTGQIWYDSASTKLKFYDGNTWKASGGALSAATSPTAATVGDFWWDNANEQLYVYNGTTFTLIGPQNAGEGLTQMQSTDLLGQNAVNNNIIATTINDVVIAVSSNAESFDIDATNTIPGFSKINKGITLVNTPSTGQYPGVTTSEHRFHGTATAAEKIVIYNGNGTINRVINAADLVVSSAGVESNFTSVTNFKNAAGINVGENSELNLKYDAASNSGIIHNTNGTNSKILLKTTSAVGTSTTIADINILGIIPEDTRPAAAEGQPRPLYVPKFDIGTADLRWKTVYANNFNGLASIASSLLLGTYDPTNPLANAKYPSTSATPNSVAVRDSDGNLVANLFKGIATAARYADLAEKYTTAEELAPGTAVAVCAHEDYEVEPASASNFCIGVVSTNPAVMMNSEAEGQYIGLKGRLPVRVKGAVKKGQAVYALADGVCTTLATSALVGVALESNSDEGEKLVECVLKV